MNTPHLAHTIGHSLYMIGLLICLVLLTIIAPMNTTVLKAIGSEELISKTNDARERFAVKPITINSQLMSAAQAKAEHMVSNQYFAHFSPDGRSPWDFIKQAGYSYVLAGENLAITNESEDAVIDGWLNSPTHRENLLNTEYSEFGIGVASYGTYQNHSNTTVIVALYARPTNQSLAVIPQATTSPAGTVAVLEPTMGQNIYMLAGVGIGLIIAGALLELRHIKRHAPQRLH